MITGSPVKMLSEMGVRSVIGGGGDGGDREIELNLYRSGSAPPTVEGSLTAVGGLFGGGGGGGGVASGFTVGENGNGFLSEEDLRADPAYVSYYYSHAKLNPRLPPPVLSKEDWRLAQRAQAGSSALGGIGDRRKVNWGGGSGVKDEGGGSLFSLQPGFGSHNGSKVELRKAPGSGDWLDRGEDGLIGLSGIALGRQKSFADILQEDLNHTTPISGHPSRPSSHNTLNDGVDPLGSVETHPALHREISSIDGLQPGGNIQSVDGLQNIGLSTSHTFASVWGSSLSRSTTPDPPLVARAPSPHLGPVGARLNTTDMTTNNGSCSFNDVSPSLVESDDILAALSGMSLSTASAVDAESIVQSKLQQEIDDHQNLLFGLQGGQNHSKQRPFLKKSEPGHLGMSSVPQSAKSSYSDSAKRNVGLADLRNSASRANGQVKLHMPTFPSANSYLNGSYAPSVASPGGSAHYQNVDGAHVDFASYGIGGYAVPSMMANHIATSNLPPLFDSRVLGGGLPSGSNLTGPSDLQNLDRIGNQKAAAVLQMPVDDPLYVQHLKTAGYAAQVAANFGDPPMGRGYRGNSYVDLLEMQKAYLGALVQSHEQYGMPFLGKLGALGHPYYGNPAFGVGVTYPGKNPLASPILPTSPVELGSPLRHGERNMHFPSGLRQFAGGIMSSWHSDTNGSMEGSFASSLLEEFKSNKTRCFELSEIAGHVVEFSADQYGSRFIQQKLETATTEEKNMVYEEIMPQALSLMTDVFGNYVVQKFFEHGSAAQIRELANQLNGHVLALSLQMYGCRVIQKAIEVVDLDHKTKMVAELDGHIMRCVRDQNGNHVIQKCIECIPQDSIQFIISTFHDQVVTLSTHPYGCRVVQRILEHCDNPKTQQIVMDEIMQCICMLAQDQYGNYVVQHVLEHGKPHERSVIIEKLAGQIVQMSQQKFASNVVEKCLTFGGPEERQILVNEMIGSTDENEPLQAMMKDQFGNYVVQKVLETCSDQQRELILSRIKVHLNALKKYTYGKHIVARVEKLVAAGERRIGLQSLCPS